jgi:hypothetical protein
MVFLPVTSNIISKYALDNDLPVSGTLVSSKSDNYDIKWNSGDFLAFGYFKGKAVHFMLTFNLTGLPSKKPNDAYIELYQIRQVGSHPWNSNPWCDRGPTVLDPKTNLPYGNCLRVTVQNKFGTSVELDNNDHPPSSLDKDALIEPVSAIRLDHGKKQKTGMKYQLHLDVMKINFNNPIQQILVSNNYPNRRPNGRYLRSERELQSNNNGIGIGSPGLGVGSGGVPENTDSSSGSGIGIGSPGLGIGSGGVPGTLPTSTPTRTPSVSLLPTSTRTPSVSLLPTSTRTPRLSLLPTSTRTPSLSLLPTPSRTPTRTPTGRSSNQEQNTPKHKHKNALRSGTHKLRFYLSNGEKSAKLILVY